MTQAGKGGSGESFNVTQTIGVTSPFRVSHIVLLLGIPPRFDNGTSIDLGRTSVDAKFAKDVIRLDGV